MELTRRDALAALAASGVTVGAGAVGWEVVGTDRPDTAEEPATGDDGRSVAFTDREARTLATLARTLYPSAVTGVPEFVETYVVGRVRDRPAYAEEIRAALAALEEYAIEWFDGAYTELSPANRETLLRQMGLHVADPNPDGTDPERIRYYLVNELLYALYSSPTGGSLVGIENPTGHPGGLASYRRDSPPDG